MKDKLEVQTDIDDFIQIQKLKEQFESMTSLQLVKFYINKQNDDQPLKIKFLRLFALKNLLWERYQRRIIRYKGDKIIL